MNDIYKEELKTLTDIMLKAEQFAKQFPIFEEYIINNKIT